MTDQTENHFGSSISHTKDLLVVAVTLLAEIGLDVEYIDKNIDYWPIAKKVCNNNELEYLEQLPICNRRADFYRIWTLKEAIVKSKGEGILSLIQRSDAHLGLFDDKTNDKCWYSVEYGLDHIISVVLNSNYRETLQYNICSVDTNRSTICPN